MKQLLRSFVLLLKNPLDAEDDVEFNEDLQNIGYSVERLIRRQVSANGIHITPLGSP